MRRRELLAAAGSLAAVGGAGCLSRGGGGPAKTDRDRSPTSTGTATPTPTEPTDTATVGDPTAVLLPEENKPHEVVVRNAADETREIGVRITSHGTTRYENAWALSAGAFVRFTLVDPAAYTVSVTVHGGTAGEVAVETGLFDCNDTRTTIDVRPDGTLDPQTVSTQIACRSPIVLDHAFEVTGSACGTGQQAAVAFGSSSVTVTGGLRAPTPCHGAELAGASWDGEGGKLTLTVATTDPDDDACVDCIGEIDYEATVSFADAPPETVVVNHRHWDRTDTITTARR
ncbi:MAG: hypothetical protein ABEJ68_03865 [Halobacteriaceae archaeon]